MEPQTLYKKHFLSGGGEMGALTRAKDWSKTPVGSPENWPQSLRTTLDIILHSKFPMFLWWGPDLICFYNDAYRPSLGQSGKHPSILGMRAEEAWSEIWTIIKPLIDQVLQEGESMWMEDQLIPIYRNGKLEDVYWTFSYSPVSNDSGAPGGVLVTCYESTEKVRILKEIEERENQLSFAINAGELATWDLDPATNRFIGNERLKEWFGLLPEDEIELQVALNRIVESDRQRVIDAIQLALLPASGGNYEIEYSIINPVQNKERRVLAKGKSLFNENNIPVRFSGTLEDITEQVIARKKLEESEKEFRQLADSLPQLVWTTDAFGAQTFASRRWKEFTGLDPYDEDTFQKMVHPDDLENVLQVWADCLASGKIYKTELRLRNYVGEYKWFYVNGEPVKNDNGEIEKWIGAFTDINEQKKAEEERWKAYEKVEESEKRFRNTVRQAPIGIAILKGSDFIVETANETYLHLIDRDQHDFIGKPLFESLPEVKESVAALLKNVLTTGNPFYGNEFPVPLKKQGKEVLTYFDFIYQPFREENGEITGIMVVATDVTDSVKSKHSLAESEKQFRNLVMQSPVAMTIFRGPDYIIERANKVMFEKIWRKKESEVLGRKALEVFPELRDQKYEQLLHKVYTSGIAHKEIESVAYIQGDDGMKKFYLDFEYLPLHETNGSVSGIMITVNDETEKVEARKKVEDAEERLRLATEAAELATWELDLRTREIIYSARLLEIFGHEKERDLKHAEMRKQIHPDDLKIVEDAFEKAMQSGLYIYEARMIRPDNRVCWVSTQGKVFYDEENKPFKLLGTLRDITEDKLHEQGLLESEEKFRLLADSMPQFVWTGDREGNLTYFNQSVYEYTGLTPEQTTDGGWIQIVHPEEREENIRQWLECIRTGNDFIFEHRFRRNDGEYRWQLSRAIPQRDAYGNIQMWVGTSTDIHEMKELDQQKDYFISMASHELKTPFTSLKGYAQILHNRYQNSGDVFLTGALNTIDRQITRLTKLIAELLDLSKIKSGSLSLNEEYFPVNELIKEIAEEIRHINPAYSIDFIKGTEVTVYADKERIGQVLTNLLNNAIKYSPASNKIKIESVISNNMVTVSVEDYGVGILKKDHAKIFERFYRVEGKNEKTFPGFGIGLFIASEIVRRSNGQIGVESEPGKGSVFYFSLPLQSRV